MNWNESVIIPEISVRRAERLGLMFRAALWIGSHALYRISAALALLAWLISRWSICKKKRL
jgi:hypothetical protein